MMIRIQKIKSCVFDEMIDDTYYFRCRIIRHGHHRYAYQKGDRFISLDNDYGKKRLWLDDDAFTTITNAVHDVDASIEEICKEGGSYRMVEWCSGDLKLYYKHSLPNPLKYHAYIRTRNTVENQTVQQLFEDLSLSEIFSRLSWSAYLMKYNLSAFEPTADTIETSPLYLSAVENGDKVLQYDMEMMFGEPSQQARDFLTGIDNVRRLPRLSEAFDRDYVVVADTIDSDILGRSCYRILHAPYYSMKGRTHRNWALNPHQKVGVDAAPCDSPSISFTDYLELFPVL